MGRFFNGSIKLDKGSPTLMAKGGGIVGIPPPPEVENLPKYPPPLGLARRTPLLVFGLAKRGQNSSKIMQNCKKTEGNW